MVVAVRPDSGVRGHPKRPLYESLCRRMEMSGGPEQVGHDLIGPIRQWAQADSPRLRLGDARMSGNPHTESCHNHHGHHLE